VNIIVLFAGKANMGLLDETQALVERKISLFS
jgi:hypothetical protein